MDQVVNLEGQQESKELPSLPKKKIRKCVSFKPQTVVFKLFCTNSTKT